MQDNGSLLVIVDTPFTYTTIPEGEDETTTCAHTPADTPNGAVKVVTEVPAPLYVLYMRFPD